MTTVDLTMTNHPGRRCRCLKKSHSAGHLTACVARRQRNSLLTTTVA